MASRTGLTLLRNARQGDAHAQLALGRVYLTGEHGLGKSYVTAYHWLEMAARAGLAEAWTLIGQQIPLNALQDVQGALPWYRRAAADGIAQARRAVGSWLLAQGDDEATRREALDLLKQAGAQEDVEAQELLGALYLAGQHVPPDRSSARIWLERAAAQGSMQSRRQLIVLFSEDRDLAGVERHARPLALQGEAHACYALGMALLGLTPVPTPSPAGAPGLQPAA